MQIYAYPEIGGGQRGEKQGVPDPKNARQKGLTNSAGAVYSRCMTGDHREKEGNEVAGARADYQAGRTDAPSQSEQTAQPGKKRRRGPSKQERVVVTRNPEQNKVWYTKAEAAAYLKVSIWTIQLWMRQDKITAHRLPTTSPTIEPGSAATDRDYRRVRFHIDELRRVAGLYLLDVLDDTQGASLESAGPLAEPATAVSSDQQHAPNDSLRARRLAAERHAIRPFTFRARYEFNYGDDLITKFMAAIILGVDVRTVERYLDQELLHVIEERKGPDGFIRQLLSRTEVEALLASGS